MPTNEAVCIVGAGPAGLSLARALKQLRIPYRQFERHDDVGGIWDIANPGSPIYQSAHFISSRKMSGFFDFPMSKDLPDYPSHRDILRYCRDFARSYDLYSAIELGTVVEHVESVGSSFRVQTSTGEQRYRALVCASGVTWHPNLPLHPGSFDGEIRHSVTYKHPDEFRGKRVLIVGMGNSGADIACDAAANAAAAFISTRRGYHVVPKHVFGIPSDELDASGPQLPLALKRAASALLTRVLVGDVARLGLPKPDHKLFETHPLLNTQLLHHLQHGNIRVKPDVSRFEHGEVIFKDGSREPVDLVLYATGYEMKIPYVPREYFHWRAGRPQLYLTAFNRHRDNLFGLGYLETNASAFTLFDRIAHMIAHYLSDQRIRPDRAAAFRDMICHDRPDLSGGIRFIDSDRHKAYVEIRAYKKYIEAVRERMQWPQLTPGCFDPLRATTSAH